MFFEAYAKALATPRFQSSEQPKAKIDLISFIQRNRKRDQGCFEERDGTSWTSWQARSAELILLADYFSELPKGSRQVSASHTRHIPGDVRQEVLQDFVASGRYCPGVKGRTKRHKLGNEEPIEFDHIVPYASKGSSLTCSPTCPRS